MIRLLEQSDRTAWNPLWDGYLTFYQADVSPSVTNLTWDRLLDPDTPFQAFGVFEGDKLVGIAHTLTHLSTWAENGYLYLEDLFVDDTQRGKGYASRLIEHIYHYADEQKLERVYWITDTDNPARKLYDRYAKVTDFVQYRRAT